MTTPRRAALYLRVSTARQAERDLSIPDQQRQAEAHCRQHGWPVVAAFLEQGASATDDRRPEFQRMLDAAATKPRPFDVIVVHSLSRFFRDAIEGGVHLRRLRRLGVEVVSITQPTAEDASGELVRTVLMTFDAYQSQENAKHTLRAMKENARAGFWNGAPPPYGYRIEVAERRGDKDKKRLAIAPAEAAVVRQVFDLYLHGRVGLPMGVKGIADTLNRTGVTYRGGRRFSLGLVHRVLTRETYIGRHAFNVVTAKTGETKPADEHVTCECPAIIAEETFARVQQLLASRNPKQTPPRAVSGPTLLTGLAVCASCGGGMVLNTGTAKNGTVHRYYACSTAGRMGKTVCTGRRVRMDALDSIVVEGLAERVFAPERLGVLVGEVLAAKAAEAAGAGGEVAGLHAERRKIDQSIDRLAAAVEAGTFAPDDDTIRTRFSALRDRKAELLRLIGQAERRRSGPALALPAASLDRFSAAMQTKLREAPPELRKALVRLFVGHVEVGEAEVRIAGPKAALAAALAAEPDSALPAGPGVRGSVRGWRPIGDSNHCCRRERAVTGLAMDGHRRSIHLFY